MEILSVFFLFDSIVLFGASGTSGAAGASRGPR
jgi:hypothetical protein